MRQFFFATVYLMSATCVWADDVPKVVRLGDALEVGSLQVVGEAEMAELPGLDVVWRARIDSGATTTSIHAVDLEEFERDGKPWVKFTARNDLLKTTVELERQVTRIAQIQKRGSDETQRRPVVALDLKIGKVTKTIEVNLTDRTNFEFPVLIGRNYLSGTSLVDVSRDYLHGTPDEER